MSIVIRFLRVLINLILVLPPVLVPRHTEVPDKMPQIENYAMTVPENTEFPTGNNEIFNLPGIFIINYVEN